MKASNKWKFSVVTLVLLIAFIFCAFLPSPSHQLGLQKFIRDEDGVIIGVKPKKRFQFHKLTRNIDVSDDDDDDEDDDEDDDDDDNDVDDDIDDDDNDDDNDDDDDDGDDDDDDSDDNKKKRNKDANNDDDDDDDDEIVKKPKYDFERLKKKIPAGRSPIIRKLEKIVAEEENELENNEIEYARKKLFGLFDWFGVNQDDDDNEKKDSNEDNDNNEPVTDETKENGIINWLQSLRTATVSKPIESEEDSWVEYLDRWPFNTIFQFNKIEKYAFPPKPTIKANQKIIQPISDEHFNNLLDRLPSFFVNPNYVKDIDCRQQLQILHRQLRGHKLWTMQMLDASAKVPSGLLRGNTNQFGDFDMCTNIKTVVKVTKDISVRIKGKYCLAHIEFLSTNDELKYPVYLSHGRGLWNSHVGDPSHFAPRYSIINWGICIPNLCPAKIVHDTIDYNLRPYNHTGINFHVEIDEDDCFIRNSTNFKRLMKKQNNVGITVGYFMFFLSLVITAIIIENKKNLCWIKVKFIELLNKRMKNEASDQTENDSEKKSTTETVESETKDSPTPMLKEIIMSFSPKRTISELFALSENDSRFAIFHIFKILCTFMLYVCLKFLMMGHLPILNRENLVKSFDNPISIIFRSPLIYLDILLMISGFLKSYKMCIEMEEKSNIYVIKRMTGKFLSYLPTLYAILLFQTWILPHLGSGPLWSNLIGRNQKICEESMWRNLFGVQNVLNVEETCSPMTIQHSIEMQLYLLTPLIVWLFYSNSDIGFVIYGGLHAMSVAIRYSRTNLEHLSITIFHGIHVSKFYRTANLLYASPLPRATAYLIGIGAAILHKTSGSEWQEMSKIGKLSGWLTAILSILWCFWYPHNGVQTNFKYNAIDAAAYASWSPLLLGLGLGWIIFMLPTTVKRNETNLQIHSLLTCRPILFLSRISYTMQLVSYVVVLYFTANVKESIRYSITDLIDFGEIIFIIFISIILSIFIDIPVKKIQKILIDKLLPDSVINEEHYEDEHDIEEVEEEEEEHVDEVKQNDIEQDVQENLNKIADDTADKEIIDIWGSESDPDLLEERYLIKRNSMIRPKTDDENWRTESDIEVTIDLKDNFTSETVSRAEEADNEEDDEDEEDDEEEKEIDENAEVIRRPDTPDLPPPTQQQQPPPATVSSTPTYRRRRFYADD